MEQEDKIKQIQHILREFMAKMDGIRHERDEKIKKIYKKYEEKKMQELLQEIDGIKK